jgi:hypothetical protein
MTQVCEMCHARTASPITLHYAKALPASTSDATQETSPDAMTIKLPDGRERQVTNTGQQEVLICNKCFIKQKLSCLLKASVSCLGTLLIGGLVIGLVGGIIVYVIPRDTMPAASGIVSLIGGILLLGLLITAVQPVGEAVRFNKRNLSLS